MTIAATDLADILKRRARRFGDGQISYGELNTIIALYDRTAKTDCAHFNKQTWMCDEFMWSFCLKANCGTCPNHRPEQEV